MKLRLAAGLLLAPALLLTACSGSVSVGTDPAVPKTEVESQISTKLAEATTTGVAIESVTCPGDLTGKVGTTMNCTVTTAAGSGEVVVTVTSVDGTKVGFNVKVAEAAGTGTPGDTATPESS